MTRLLAALFALLFLTPAVFAQTSGGVRQKGAVTPGNCTSWAGTNIIQDAGAACSAGGGGTVTTLSVTTTNGVSGTVANPTTTPAISLVLGAITPTTVNGLTLSSTTTGTLRSNGTGVVTATTSIPVTDLNAGTSATSSTFWRGDGTWATPSGSALAVTATTGNANFQPLFATGTGASVSTVYVDPASPLTYNPSTGLLSTLGHTTTTLTVNTSSALSGTTTISSAQILGGNALLTTATVSSGLVVTNALSVTTSGASPVNNVAIYGRPTGLAPIITTVGTDTAGVGLGIAITAVNATTTGNGGPITITAGRSFGLLTTGGVVTINGGSANSGDNSNFNGVVINGGNATAGAGGNVSISGGSATTGNTSGTVTITGASGVGAAGGTVSIAAGGSNTTQSGVNASFTGGAGGSSGNQNGGSALITGGVSNGSGTGGLARLLGGTVGTNGIGGTATVQGGAGNGTGAGGPVSITGGAAGATSTGGTITLTSGAGGATSGVAGSITLNLGTTTSSAGGTLPSVNSGGFLAFTTTQAAIATKTGVHSTTANALSLTATGVDELTVSAGLVAIPNIASDATHTTATVCEDTTTHALYFGSGTVGICLGTSSVRYKHDIKPIAEGLGSIEKLRPVSFYYNKGRGDNGAKLQYGFIAEDMFSVIPKLVDLDKSGKPNSVDLVGLIPVMVRAIQEQQREIDELKRRLAE